MKYVISIIGLSAIIIVLLLVWRKLLKGSLHGSNGKSSVGLVLLPILLTSGITLIGYIGVNTIQDLNVVKLTESQLAQYISKDLSNSKMEYDIFTSPDETVFSFEIPEKYIYCTYVSSSGKIKNAIAGDRIKAKEATLVYRYINENENKVALSNVPDGVSDFYSLYINVYDSILSTGSAIFGYDLEDIRYVILDENWNWLAGGTYAGSTLEITNAYEGIFIMLFIGNDSQNLNNEMMPIELDRHNLMKSEGYKYLDGVMYNNDTNLVTEVRNFVEHYPDSKEYWSQNIYMMYKDRVFYDVTFKRFTQIDLNGYLFYPDSVILRTSPDVCDKNNNSFGAYLNFVEGFSDTFKILEGDYYMLPNAVCYIKPENIIGGVQCSMADFEQVISIPKDIDSGGYIQLELNPQSDTACVFELNNMDESSYCEFLTYERYDELTKSVDDVWGLYNTKYVRTDITD